MIKLKLKENLKTLFGLVSVTANIAVAHSHEPITYITNSDQTKMNEENSIQQQKFKIISEEELVKAIETNSLEYLLYKKGILIQKTSAEGTICLKTGNSKTGAGN